MHESCDEVLGRRVSNRKECLSEESESLIMQRECFNEMNGCNEIGIIGLAIKQGCKEERLKGQEKFFNTLATKAENAVM